MLKISLRKLCFLGVNFFWQNYFFGLNFVFQIFNFPHFICFNCLLNKLFVRTFTKVPHKILSERIFQADTNNYILENNWVTLVGQARERQGKVTSKTTDGRQRPRFVPPSQNLDHSLQETKKTMCLV